MLCSDRAGPVRGAVGLRKRLQLRAFAVRRAWSKANAPADPGRCRSQLELVLQLVACLAIGVGLVVMLVMWDTAGVRQGQRPVAASGVAWPWGQKSKSGPDGTIHHPAGIAGPRRLAEIVFEENRWVLKSGTPMDAAAYPIAENGIDAIRLVCKDGVCALLESDVDRIQAALEALAKKCRGVAL